MAGLITTPRLNEMIGRRVGEGDLICEIEDPSVLEAEIELTEDGVARVRAGQDVRGFEVDAAARKVLIDAGFADHILHRTGHSLGQEIHGNGVHMDDYETHDDRRLIPGTGFTVEPGLYFDAFGVRTEINVYRGEHEAIVTGPRQGAVVTLG